MSLSERFSLTIVMKNKTKDQVLWLTLILLTAFVTYMWYNPRIIKVPVKTIVRVPPRPIETRREPEFRGPPIKRYKPGHMQQMGIITGPNEETLPLYGKEARGRRDRYHYYTTTPGDQMYSLPITHDARDCMEDIGCPEFYGNESVSVLGQTGAFQAKMYRTDNFF